MPFRENSNKRLKIRLSSNKANPQKKTLHQINALIFKFAPKYSKKHLFAAMHFTSEQNER